MAKEINTHKIVVLSGAGISAESGIKTFRDSGGLWDEHPVELVASPQGWKSDPELVLDFYNQRRQEISKAQPNKAHLAIAELEANYEVVVITQNIDDLHERAGSNTVIHVHGEITKARSSIDSSLIYDISYQPIKMGQRCELREQLRPHIVWFGESIMNYEIARDHIKNAGRVLVVGTSLSVYPFANLLKKARYRAEKIIVSLDIEKTPFGYNFIRSKATEMVPHITERWLKGQRV